MKKRVAIFMAYLSMGSTLLLAQGVILRLGETFTATFDSLEPWQSLPGASDQVSVEVSFDPAHPVLHGHGFTVRLDEHATIARPFYSQTFFPNTDEVVRFGFGPLGSHWRDREGKIEIYVDAGEFTLLSFDIRSTRGGEVFRQVLVVPEPPSVSLALLGLLLAGVAGLKRRFQAGKSHSRHAGGTP